MKVPCKICGEQMTPAQNGSFVKISGWAEARRKGVNAVRGRVELGEYAHGPCLKLELAGISKDQGQMFEESR